MATETTKLTFVEGAAASTPAASRAVIYAKADGLMYSKDDAGTETLMSSGPAGSGIAATIFDAKGDIIAATAADTAARLAVGATNDMVLASASGESTGLQWQARSKFKQTILDGGGNKTTTSTTFVAIDTTNLPYLTHTLAIGDVVRCSFMAQARHSTSTNVAWDFEVDRPTSADTRIGANADYGCLNMSVTVNRWLVNVFGLFVATEAGVHGFRPMWKTVSGTLTLCNAASADDDSLVQFIVEKLGPVTA